MVMLPEDLDAPPFTDDDLDAYCEAWETLDAEEAPDSSIVIPTNVTAWFVCDTSTADWAMRKLGRAEARITEIKADAQRFVDQIKKWEAEQLRPHSRASNYFTGRLTDYARHMREDEGVKTLKLPSGQVPSRLNPARPEVTAEEKFIEWARTTPMVKAKWSPVIAEVKKRVSFERVRVPDFGDGSPEMFLHWWRLGYSANDLRLVRWPRADGEMVWVAAPPGIDPFVSLLDDDEMNVAAEDLPNFHDEVWAICEGTRVPGVVEVPAEVIYTPKPALP